MAPRTALLVTAAVLASGWWLGAQTVTGLADYLRAVGL